MSVCNTWPQTIVPSGGWEHGVARVAMRTDLGTGATITRTYQSRTRRSYRGKFPLLASGSAQLEALQILIERHLAGGLVPVWWLEPWLPAWYHPRVYCGVGNGSRTTFALPIVSPSPLYSTVPSIDDVRQTTGFSERSVSNLLTDVQAKGYGTGCIRVAGTEAVGQAGDISADGTYCSQIMDGGVSADCGVTQTLATMPAVKVGRVYTGVASGRYPTYTLRVDIQWYQADRSTLISTTIGTPVAMSGSRWTQATVTGTAPALAAYARVVAVRPAVSAAFIFIDCLGLHPGDWVDWFLPSVAPGLIEFAAAPTTGQVITAAAQGYRLLRCRLVDDGIGWDLLATANVRLKTIELVEDWAP